MQANEKLRWVSELICTKAPYWLINKCLHRMAAGEDKYGDFDPKKDKRNLYIEIEKELLDAINYSLMLDDGMLNITVLPELVQLTQKIRSMR